MTTSDLRLQISDVFRLALGTKWRNAFNFRLNLKCEDRKMKPVLDKYTFFCCFCFDSIEKMQRNSTCQSFNDFTFWGENNAKFSHFLFFVCDSFADYFFCWCDRRSNLIVKIKIDFFLWKNGNDQHNLLLFSSFIVYTHTHIQHIPFIRPQHY